MKLTLFVPIKLNSERLPNKMLLPLGNKFLFQHIFKTLIEVKNILIEVLNNTEIKIYIFCSNEEIKNKLPDEIIFLKRDPKLNENKTLGIEIYKSFINHVDSDYYVLCHATSPFIKKESIILGITKVISKEFDSSFSVSKIQTFCWFQNKPLNYSLENVVRTQELSPIFYETSAFFIFSKDLMLKHNRRIGFNPYLVETDRIEAIDIDEKEDYDLACKIINNAN
jgi:CMP-N-acetylneuraminic acid synthetase